MTVARDGSNEIDVEAALFELPLAYREALRLEAAGADARAIAEAAEIAIESVETVLEVANAKLEAIIAARRTRER